eukprot:1389817-Prymnesium_polylepis.1
MRPQARHRSTCRRAPKGSRRCRSPEAKEAARAAADGAAVGAEAAAAASRVDLLGAKAGVARAATGAGARARLHSARPLCRCTSTPLPPRKCLDRSERGRCKGAAQQQRARGRGQDVARRRTVLPLEPVEARVPRSRRQRVGVGVQLEGEGGSVREVALGDRPEEAPQRIVPDEQEARAPAAALLIVRVDPPREAMIRLPSKEVRPLSARLSLEAAHDHVLAILVRWEGRWKRRRCWRRRWR